MTETLQWTTLALVALSLIAAVLTLTRSGGATELRARELRDDLRTAREEAQAAARALREEVAATSRAGQDALKAELQQFAIEQREQLRAMTEQLREQSSASQRALESVRETLDTRVKELQEGNERRLGEMRRESLEGLKSMSEMLAAALEERGNAQQRQLESMTRQLGELTSSNQLALDTIRNTLDGRVRELQEGNEKKLDEMRRTVDEKLQVTLEKRLGESFKLVSDRLEAVHQGLGEMQSLASGVGDLKRVLTNVKARGTWAEVQLGALLEQVLTPDQFSRNVSVREGSSERVEFAVRLPGPKNEPETQVWLPIDSKFPQEDYLRLQEAADRGDPEAVQAATDALGRAVRAAAKDIHDKYVNPPSTTDFALLFLATEGLYAEVIRQPDLVHDLQQRLRVVVTGPTTLIALLNSLRMGFQTLAIEKRASEVWRVLGAVKTEFGKFGDVLDKVRNQLDTASKTIEKTGVRTRAIQRQLRTVEQLPQDDASDVLGLQDGLAFSADGEIAERTT